MGAPINKEVQSYIDSVLSGDRIAGVLERKAILRHLDLLEHAKEKGYFFDAKAAERAIKIVKMFRHTSGDYGGKPFQLLPWQAFILWVIFGWKVKATGLRLIRKAYVEVAKKNGKTELAAAIGLILAFFDGEFGAEVYAAANTRDQAKICWKSGWAMAKMLSAESPSFANGLDLYNSTANCNIVRGASFFKPIPAEPKTLDGVRPNGAVIDEYHEAVDNAVIQNLESGMVNRSQPLLFIITTAGFNINGPCFQYRKVAADILNGIKEDDTTFTIIFSPDENDDWNDENTWHKANPSLGQTPTWDGIRAAYQKAVNEGADQEINFRTKNQNEWVRTRSRWISDEVFMKNSSLALPDPRLKWWAGLDLALTYDITAAIYFSEKDPTGKHRVLCDFFCPEDNAKERAKRDKVPYLDWIRDGLMTATPGNVTDYDYVLQSIIERSAQLGCDFLYFDPYKATQINIELTTRGMDCQSFQQTTRWFNAPIEYLAKALLSGQIAHGGDPVLRWMFQNVLLYIDGNGNKKIDKGKSEEKVDGVVALAMAAAGFLNAEIQQKLDYGENVGLTIF